MSKVKETVEVLKGMQLNEEGEIDLSYLFQKNDECMKALTHAIAVLERIGNLSTKDLGKIVMFIRHNMFLPENDKLAELNKLIASALIEEVCKNAL